MATNYPGAIDSLTNPGAGAALNSPSHAGQHANANDAIEAIETELGTNPKGTFTTVRARLDNIELTGAGSPEGAVTASPGARYLQTSATTDVKGWIRWVKASGTGNTGWVAGAEADTGWRDVSSGFTGGYTSGDAYVRRVGSQVVVRCSSGTTPTLTNAAWNTLITLGVGFRPWHNVDPAPWNAGFGSDLRRGYVGTDGTVAIMGAGATVAATNLHVTFTTTDPWPSSLPGSAA